MENQPRVEQRQALVVAVVRVVVGSAGEAGAGDFLHRHVGRLGESGGTTGGKWKGQGRNKQSIPSREEAAADLV